MTKMPQLPYFLEITTYNTKRKVASQSVKEIFWHDRKTDKRQRLGAITKANTSDGIEFQVYYIRDNYTVEGKSDGGTDTQNWVLMDIFPSLKDAEKYVCSVFHNEVTLKEEMFNVYIKLLQPLG